MTKQLNLIYFSATDTTAKVIKEITQMLIDNFSKVRHEPEIYI